MERKQHKLVHSDTSTLDVNTRRSPPSSPTAMADNNVAVGPYPAHPAKQPDIPVAASLIPSTPLEYHRGSISTTRTSSTEFSIQDIDEPLIPLPRVTSRPRASYKLDDFIIQRTLGTGSFGRVHLGQFFVLK